MKFNVGDTVQYVGNFTSRLKGKTGVVVEHNEDDNVKVKWDDYHVPQPYGVLPENLKLVREKENDMNMYETVSNNSAKTFWMVTGDMNAPRVRHYSKQVAKAEAQRLAKANPGKEFYVLEATDGYKSSDVTKIL